MYDILELNKKLLPELKDIAKQLNVKKADLLRKQDLIYKILDQQAILATEGKKPESRPESSHQAEMKRRGRRPRRENERTDPAPEARPQNQQPEFTAQPTVEVEVAETTNPTLNGNNNHEAEPANTEKPKGNFFSRAFENKRPG